VTGEQEIHVSPGGGVIGLHLGGQPIRPAAADFAFTRRAKDAVAVGQTHAVQVILEAAPTIDAHGRVVVGGRHEQVKTRLSQYAFDRILPPFVGHIQRLAEVDHFVGAQAQLGA
jgi:hypothetical protein